MGRGSSGIGAGGGAVGGNPYSDGIVTEAQQKTLKQIAKRTANLKNEQLRIVDENGNVVLEKRGGKNEVALTVGESREYETGSVVIHNHPDGGTFSDADLSSFGYGARAIQVSTPEGTYTLVNKNFNNKKRYDGWVGLRDKHREIKQPESELDLRRQIRNQTKNGKTQRAMDKINNTYMKIRQKSGTEAANNYARKTKEQYDKLSAKRTKEIDMGVRKAITQPYHEMFKRNAAQYGFKYSFVPNKSGR